MAKKIENEARVFIDPAPKRGAHAGFRGKIMCDELGVHIDEECDILMIDYEDEADEWPRGVWDPVETPVLIPWHRIFCIEWHDKDWLDTQRERTV